MFSKTGARTIVTNKVFQSNFANVDELVTANRNAKKFRPASLSGGDHDAVPAEIKHKLPSIQADADKKVPVLVVPGLASELKRIENEFATKGTEEQEPQQVPEGGSEATETLESSVPTDVPKVKATKAPKHITVTFDDYLTPDMPKTYAELEEMRSGHEK